MWINHEWLAECVMYLAFAIGGGTGLVVLKMLVVLATVGLVWSELRRQQVDSATRDLLIALTVVGTFPQANHVRPQIFSIVAFAILLWILVAGGSLRRLLLIPLLFAAWVNFHGGWIVGGGVLAMWAMLSWPASLSREEKSALFLTGAMALIGTLANPYGWRMWEFLTSTVGFGRAEITDWQPLYRLGAGYVALWAVLALAGPRRMRSTPGSLASGNCVVWVLSSCWGSRRFRSAGCWPFSRLLWCWCSAGHVAAALSAWRGASTFARAFTEATRNGVGSGHCGGAHHRRGCGFGEQPDLCPHGSGSV